MRNWVF